MVILLHASAEPNPAVNAMSTQGITLWWSSNIYDALSRVCIPLFVMLTGALLLEPSKADEPLKVFFKKRWLRIGVPFIFWGAVYFAWDFLVVHQINYSPITPHSIVQGILTGPEYQFWFLYLLVGLYLLTPILRIVIKHASWSTLRYLLLVWFVGTSLIPILALLTPFTLDANVFVLTGWVGYYILGTYLIQLSPRRSTLYAALILGMLWTVFGTYLVAATMGMRDSQFYFQDAANFNIIIASASLFLILWTVPRQTFQASHPHLNHAAKAIGENTLPIFLMHVVVLEVLQNGYLGFKITVTTLNPIISIPLATAATLAICLAVILPLKKLPHVKRIIG